ncbi:cytoplasmic tRNA 2-thiolation protein 2 isoform X1 [Eumetopias jubatus]|uniref:cytoplasmic tRNA 2-thiolation protein 2 isoform X1 n=1 Tax=Eumetopias jubatus TaxID=34886 RepID=UPI00101722E1|nr:cytoplasmic tRNA 2-thiolation protein 2 isoform X1 [Eumetopias jubatus]
MCQVGEDYGDPAPEGPPPPRPGRELRCVKCSEGLPVVVIRAGDAFCRDCFRAFYIHKFRAVLGKNRLIFPGEKVLLAWSGGPSSSSMVWQVLEGLSRDSAKRLRFVPGVVYVDEGAACGQSREDRAKTLSDVKRILQTLGFPWHVVTLEEVFALPPSVLRCSAPEPVGTVGTYKVAVDSFLQQQHTLEAEGVGDSPSSAQGEAQPSQPCTQDPQDLAEPPPAAQTEALSRLFDSVKTLTAKEELLQTLRTHLILHVARTHGYSKVMTGDSCTRLAIKLMTSLALGRGAFLAWDTGFSDERHGDVVVVRPMREHTLKEVAFYNRLFAVPSVFTPAIDTKAPEKASIHRLMEGFLLRLQAQFPSTVSTVYRTSEKLVKAPRDGCASGPRCLLCMCSLDVDTADSATAFGAQTQDFSQMQPPTPLAEAGAPTMPCRSAEVGRAPNCCQGTRPCRREDSRARVIKQLCYGCRVNMKDVVSRSHSWVVTGEAHPPGLGATQPLVHGHPLLQPSLDPLPPYILAEAQLRSQRLSPEIQEYLLENSDDRVHTSGSGAWGPPEDGGEEGQTVCDCINKNIFN